MCIYSIILAGGVGSRLHSDTPKQYLKVNNKEILAWTLLKFETFDCIDKIIVVIDEDYYKLNQNIIDKNGINKFSGFAKNGETRQLSIYNGLKFINENFEITNEDLVIVHDACRPLLSENLINKLVETSKNSIAVMPTLPIKDTVYFSKNGITVDNLLDRNCLFAGQAPECFNLKKYLSIHNDTSLDKLKCYKGSSEIVFDAGYDVNFISGEEQNFKITTREDLERFMEIVKFESLDIK